MVDWAGTTLVGMAVVDKVLLVDSEMADKVADTMAPQLSMLVRRTVLLEIMMMLENPSMNQTRNVCRASVNRLSDAYQIAVALRVYHLPVKLSEPLHGH